jgi:hypothetical protein
VAHLSELFGNFREFGHGEVRRISLPGTSVNRGKK